MLLLMESRFRHSFRIPASSTLDSMVTGGALHLTLLCKKQGSIAILDPLVAFGACSLVEQHTDRKMARVDWQLQNSFVTSVLTTTRLTRKCRIVRPFTGNLLL